jgi:hypothetical protein
METKIVYKDAFGVIGKMGQGPAENAAEWIAPIWLAAAASKIANTLGAA